MHELINQEMVETIRTTGKTSELLPDRVEILEKYKLPYDRSADNAIITGCQILSSLPRVISTLARLFDRKSFSYTFLSEEYCCGNYLYRPAIAARDDAAMAECRELSREFVTKNVDRARKLGVKRLVIFCSPCYPIYKYNYPEQDIVFYPAAINEVLEPVRCDRKIDYYAGCYKLHRRFAPIPMDLSSTDDVLAKMEGLQVNRIDAPKCCFKPEGLSHMLEGVTTDLMVHICTGCYGQAQQNLPQDKATEVLMLPEFVERVLNQ